jgi:hypothetical protein
LKSLSDDTHEDRIFRGEADTDTTGLRARLEAYSRDAPPSSNGPPADEPVTPELALVDPDLARRARELLPEPLTEPAGPPSGWTPDPADTRTDDGQPPPAPVVEAEERRPRRKRRLVAWMLAVTLLGAVAGAALSRTTSVPEFVSDHAPDSIGPIGDRTSPSPAEPPTSQPSQSKQPQSPPANGTPTATETTGTVPSANPPTAPRPTAPLRRAAPSGRDFAWVPAPRAASYLVQFYRGRREIFRAQPRRPRLVLPGQWSFKGHEYRLVPGRYRWSVRPRLRGSQAYGSPIVRAKLLIQRDSGDQSRRRR